MKNKLPIIMVVLVAWFIIVIVGLSRDEPLDPSVTQALVSNIPEISPADNIFIGVFGIGGLQDGDVASAGEKYFREGYPRQDASRDDERFDNSYTNPCSQGQADNCLEQILAEASDIEAAVQKNQKLIDRYRLVQTMPEFVNITENYLDPAPNYSYLIESTRLLSAKSLVEAHRGHVVQALDSIEMELDFYKKIYQSDYISLIDLMIAAAAVQINLITIDRIIADERIDLSGQEERLRKMLDLDLDPVRAMSATLTFEKRMGASHITRANGGNPFHFDDGMRGDLKKMIFSLFYKENMTLNQIAAKADEAIRRNRDMPMLNFPGLLAAYRAGLPDPDDESGLEVAKLFKKYGIFFFKNYYGEILLSFDEVDDSVFGARARDVLVMSRLLRAQLELRLMPNRPDNVPDALAALGPETLNPYTDAPFNWDAERNTIWAVNAATGTRLEVGAPPAGP